MKGWLFTVPALKSQSRLGTYVRSSVAGETVRAFIPPPLPPIPAVELSGLHQQLDRANQRLGRLNGMTRLLPDIRFLLYLYVRKEAANRIVDGTGVARN
jgi:Fic/DOC family N-terminal